MGYQGNGAIHIYRVYGISWEWSNTHLTCLWEWSNTHLTDLWDIMVIEQYTSKWNNTHLTGLWEWSNTHLAGLCEYHGNRATHIYRVYGISWEWSNTHILGLWDIMGMEQYTSNGFMGME